MPFSVDKNLVFWATARASRCRPVADYESAARQEMVAHLDKNQKNRKKRAHKEEQQTRNQTKL